ncbi:hypothetical protein D3C84_1119610 [compost metagenome]
MPGISRHQARTHPADLAAPAVHLELGTAGKGHHQLMMVMGVVLGLIVQAQEAGFEHGQPDQNLRILAVATRVAQRHRAETQRRARLKSPLPRPI